MNRHLLIPFVFVLVMLIVMRWQGNSLSKPGYGKGIVHLEFAKTESNHHQLMRSWDIQDVRLNIYLDFIFILAYTWFLSATSLALSRTGGWKATGKTFAGLSLLAGILDIVENISMLESIEAPTPNLLSVTFYCALIKFILAGAVLIFIVIAFISNLLRNRKIVQA